jgi:hypothetical protein
MLIGFCTYFYYVDWILHLFLLCWWDFAGFGTGTSIKKNGGEVNLVLWAQTFLLIEMLRSWKCLQHVSKMSTFTKLIEQRKEGRVLILNFIHNLIFVKQNCHMYNNSSINYSDGYHTVRSRPRRFLYTWTHDKHCHDVCSNSLCIGGIQIKTQQRKTCFTIPPLLFIFFWGGR